MASLERCPGGYRVVWREGGRGSKKQHTHLIARKDRALAEKARIEAELAAKKPLRRRSLLKIEEVLQRWMRSRLSGPRPNDEYVTKKSAAVARRACAMMGWETTEDITPAEVQRWRDQAGRTLRAGAVIRAILWWAKDYAEQPVDERTLVGLRPPPDEGRPPRELPTAEVVAKAMATADEIDPNVGAMVHCLATYGWRPITCARALVGDLRPDGLVVKTKGRRGHREQLVPLLPATRTRLEAIAAGRSPDAHLFLDPRNGKPWGEHERGSIPSWFRRTLKVPSYDLKFFAVTTLLDVLDPHQARALTTHKTISQLYRYARGNREREQGVIEKLLAAGTRRDTERTEATQIQERPMQFPSKRSR